MGGEVSRNKMGEALNSPAFIEAKQNILNKNYTTSPGDVEEAVNDVQKLLTNVHLSVCKVKRANKIKRKPNLRLHQPWYTEQCESLRKRIRRAGSEVSKDQFNKQKQADLSTAKRDYNRLIRKMKKQHRAEVISKLETLNSEGNTDFWPLLKKLRNTKKNISSAEMNELKTHFEKLLKKTDPQSTTTEEKLRKEDVANFTKVKTEDLAPELTKKYNSTDVQKLISTLKNGKSAYKDGIINEVLKCAKHDISDILSKVFNLIDESGYFPQSWSGNFLVPLFKKGDPTCPSNYRGLAVGSNLCKLYTKALHKKLTSFCDAQKIISPHQFGFRVDHRTNDSLFVLKSSVSHYKNQKNKSLYACFIDLSKAFDSISRSDLLYKLGNYGIKGNILKVLESMYKDITYTLKVNGKYSTPFSSTHGVKQGCNLSPLLFNLFINDIHTEFDPSCDPISLGGKSFSTLSFADDIVILSETPSGLQNSLNKIQLYCKRWGLKINCDKTKVIEFNKPFRKIRPRSYIVDGEFIEVCKKFCYLGVEISSTGSFHSSMENACKKARRALYSLYASLNVYNNEGNIPLFIKLFNILIRPILTYGSEVWGYHCQKSGSPISKFINKFHKTIMGVPNHTSNAAVHLDLNSTPIETQVKINMIKYWHRLVQQDSDRLTKESYNTLLSDGGRDPFTTAIRDILNSAGYENVWTDQSELPIDDQKEMTALLNNITNSLHAEGKHILISSAQNEAKLQNFLETSNEAEICTYLCLVKTRSSRSIIAKTRCGVLDLAIEVGRRKNIPREKRICLQCCNNIVEDNLHFMFDCTAYTIERHQFLMSCSESIEQIHNMTPAEKYISIMNCSNETTLNNLGNYLTKIHKIRQNLQKY